MSLKNNKNILDSYFKVSETPEYQLNNMIDMVLYQINRRMKEKDISKKDLAERMGIHASSLSRLLNASENTSLLTIAKASHALDLKFSAIKFIPEEQSDSQINEFKSFVKCKNSTWWPDTSCSNKNRNVYKFFTQKSIADTMEYPAKKHQKDILEPKQNFIKVELKDEKDTYHLDNYAEAVS